MNSKPKPTPAWPQLSRIKTLRLPAARAHEVLADPARALGGRDTPTDRLLALLDHAGCRLTARRQAAADDSVRTGDGRRADQLGVDLAVEIPDPAARQKLAAALAGTRASGCVLCGAPTSADAVRQEIVEGPVRLFYRGSALTCPDCHADDQAPDPKVQRIRALVRTVLGCEDGAPAGPVRVTLNIGPETPDRVIRAAVLGFAGTPSPAAAR